jgi:predicted RNase H-like HicB family nuclease
MAGNHERPYDRQVALDDVEIRPADSAGRDLHEDLAGARSRIRDVLEDEGPRLDRSRSVEPEGAHPERISLVRSGLGVERQGACLTGYALLVTLTVEIEHASSGEWVAEVIELPGCLVVEPSEDQALTRVEALALRVLADRLEHGEAKVEDLGPVAFITVITDLSERFGIRLSPPDVTRLRPTGARQPRTTKTKPSVAPATTSRSVNTVTVSHHAEGTPTDVARFFRSLAD